MKAVQVIGGGLAGCEAAWQIARAGFPVDLWEMRPVRQTPAHRSDRLAELVCSNSLKSETLNTAPWLLKQELRRFDSLLLQGADAARVPGGQALTVDRVAFGDFISDAIEQERLITLHREEVTALPTSGITVIASGPLTAPSLAEDIAGLAGCASLFFYDAISPIVDASTVDMSIAFRASRYGKSIDGSDDYINCPMDKPQYEAFLDAVMSAQAVPFHIEQDRPCYFEACLPIEEIARRGPDTLRFGPMKPMGLTDPRTGRRPYAVVQLRQENLRADSYNLVGFQNHMRFAEQARVFRLIPGLEKAEFLRYGQIHRNTYINAPALLTPELEMRTHAGLFFAGQISGVEGYVESIATGLIAGRNAAARAANEPLQPLPRASAMGSLCHYISGADPAHYQPANITFDLLPPLDETARERFRHDKPGRHQAVCVRAIEALDQYLAVHV